MTEWAASLDSDTAQVLAAGAFILDQSLLAPGLVPSTIVRVRGTLWVASDQASASEEPFGALGFSVVSDPARLIGITALPTPITDEGSELFFVYQAFQTFFATGQGVVWQRYDFESKAMRKFEDGEAIVVTLENASAAFGLEYLLKFRLLLKLH